MAVKNHEPDTHVVLFIAGFFGRGFNSPRLHQVLWNDIFKVTKIMYKLSCRCVGRSSDCNYGANRGFTAVNSTNHNKPFISYAGVGSRALVRHLIPFTAIKIPASARFNHPAPLFEKERHP